MRNVKMLAILLALLFLGGCQLSGIGSDKKGNIVIFNDAYGVEFLLKDEKLERIRQVAKTPDFFRFDYIEDTGEMIYGKTMENRKPGRPYLYQYNKISHKIKAVDDGDTYTMTHDGEHLYRTEVYTDRVNIHVYNNEMKEVKQKEFSTGNFLCITSDMACIGDRCYLLVGKVDKDTNQHANQLWVLDKNLNKLEESNLDYEAENRSGFLKMVATETSLYIVELSKGRREDGEPGPGNALVSYNIETQEKEIFHLDTPYPDDIWYDENRNILVVSHYPLYVEDAKWTFYDLDDHSQRTIALGKGFDQDANFTQYGQNYYFLFKDKLVEYNYDTDKKVEYDLTEFGFNSADVLSFIPN